MAAVAKYIVVITGHDIRTAWFAETNTHRLDNENGIRVTWKYNSPSSVSYFDIYRSLFPDKDFLHLASVAAMETSYDDRETIPDLVYYYQIMAVPLTQNKPVASNLIFGTSYNPQPPVPPYISMANGIAGGAVLQIYASDTEAKGVRIYRDNGSIPELYMVSDLIPVNDTLAIVYYDTLSMLSGKRTYTYAAKTESTSFVESEFSNRVYVRPRITTPPDAPVSLTAYEEDRQILLFWEDVEARGSGIAGYLILRREVADATDNPFIELLPDNMIWIHNHFTDTTTLPGKVYNYKIHSVDIDNNLSHEGIVSTVATQLSLPIAPFALRAIPTDEGIFLIWSQTIYPDIASVQLYRQQSGTPPILLATLPPDADEYTDTAAIPDTVYSYYLTTINKAGIESSPSEKVAVTF